MKYKHNNSKIIKFTIGGVLLGGFYAFLSTLIELIEINLPLNVTNFINIQKSNPLLWIIDSAVIVIGFFGYQIGVRQKKLFYQSENFETLVNQRSEEILRQKLFYEALVENSPIAIVTLDKKHQVISINPAFHEMFGYRSEDIMGRNLDEIIADNEHKRKAFEITKGVLAGKTIHDYGKRRRKDGSLVEVEILGKPIDIDNKRIGILGLYRDITLETQAIEDLRISEERFRRIFEDSPVALRLEDCSKLKKWAEDIQKKSGRGFRDYLADHPKEITKICKLREIISVNTAALFLFHAKNKEELQKNLCMILSEESIAVQIDIISAFLDGQTSLEREIVYKSMDGKKIYAITKLTILPGYEDTWSRILFSNLDITERKLSEERLSYISLHDIITGVYNRVFYEEEMARMEKSRMRPISILVGDMDNLKKINDDFGHQAGDTALQFIADIMQGCLRSEDVIARIGGDEFSILLPNVDEKLAQQILQRILKKIDSFNLAKKLKFPINISIGHATVNGDELFSDVFIQADTLMYQEKHYKRTK